MRCTSFYLWCCCILMLVDGQLTPVEETDEDIGILISIIAEFHRCALYKNFITYVGDLQQNLGSLQKSLMETFRLPMIVAGHEFEKLHNINSDKSLILVFFNGSHDPLLRIVEQSLINVKDVTTIFVYNVKDNALPETFIKDFFSWCLEKDLRNVFLFLRLTNTFQIWSYVFDSDIKTVRITLDQLKAIRREDYRKMSNSAQHRYLIAFYEKTTEAFLYKTRDGHVTLGGQIGLLLEELIRYMNGTMELLTLSYDEYGKAVKGESVDDRPINIFANLEAYSSMNANFPFLMTTRICLILPYRRIISLREYVSYFDRKKTLVAFMIFNFIVNSVIKRIVNPRIRLSDVFFASYQLTVSQAMTTRVLSRLSLSEKILVLTINIYNSVTFSLFVSVLTMAFITGMQMPDIVDAETFLASGLRIMAFPDQMDNMLNDIPANLSNSFTMVDVRTWLQHVDSLNDSYAYVMTMHTWLGFQLKQNRLRHPKLRVGPDKLCGVPRYLRFQLRPGLFFFESLKHFYSQIFETGLTKKWRRMGMAQAEQIGLIRLTPQEPPNFSPLPMDFYLSSLWLYAFCNFLALLVFLLERVSLRWNHIRNDRTIV